MNLITTTDKVSMITSTAAPVDVIASYTDLLQGTAGASGTQRSEVGAKGTAFSSATTLDIVTSPSASTTVRRVEEIIFRNKSTGTANTITVQATLGGTVYEGIKINLLPGETLFYKDGVGFYKPEIDTPVLANEATSSQSPFASDTYLTGSNILIPEGAPIAGTTYRLVFDVSKTNVGTGVPTVNIRVGTAGAIGDTSRCSLALGAGSAAADTGRIDIFATFRSVGSGTSAVIVGSMTIQNTLASTGLTTAVKAAVTVGGGFDSTVANSYIGASYNGGASAVHTIQMVMARLYV